MEAKQVELTEREQAYFEHVREAKAQGLTLRAYCEGRGLNVRSLYSVRRDLVDKGIVARTHEAQGKPAAAPGRFVAVRVAVPEGSGVAPLCRVRHPSGWTIECAGWPEAAWVAALMRGADRA